MSTVADPAVRPRGALRLMIDPTFGGLFWAKILSVVGVWTHCIVAAVVVFDATGSALMVGLVGVVQFGPQLIFSPLSGKWADLGNPVRQILIGRLLCVVGSGGIAVFLAAMPGLTGAGAAVTVLVGSTVLGIGFVIGGPAMQSIVPSLIRDGELPTAMALNSVPMTIGRLAGPILGAVLTAQLSAAAAFGASAVLSLVFAIFVVIAKFPAPKKRRSDVDYSVRAALRYVRDDHSLFLALIAVATVGLAADPSITLVPSMAAELGGGTHLVGALSAGFGGGAALGLVALGLTRGKVSPPSTSAVGLWLLGLGCLLLAVSSGIVLAISGFALAGVGFGWAMAGLGTVVQERAPDELRGRVMALWMVGFVGSRPAAAAVLGGTADHWSVHGAFLIAAVLTLVVAVFWQLHARRGLGPSVPMTFV
ncbi:MAG: MFS transporter [Mycobacterium sp.]